MVLVVVDGAEPTKNQLIEFHDGKPEVSTKCQSHAASKPKTLLGLSQTTFENPESSGRFLKSKDGHPQ